MAQSAGLTHAVIARDFGSKRGLVAAVVDQSAAEVRTVTEPVEFTSAEAFIELLVSARERPTWVRLLIRSGLGDPDGSVVPAEIIERCNTTPNDDRRSRLCGYGAASLVLGWLSWENFLVAGLQLGRTSHRRQDDLLATVHPRCARSHGSSSTTSPLGDLARWLMVAARATDQNIISHRGFCCLETIQNAVRHGGGIWAVVSRGRDQRE